MGADGLLSIIQSLECDRPDRFIPALNDAIRAQDPNSLSDDDATVLLIRATGTRTSKAIHGPSIAAVHIDRAADSKSGKFHWPGLPTRRVSHPSLSHRIHPACGLCNVSVCEDGLAELFSANRERLQRVRDARIV